MANRKFEQKWLVSVKVIINDGTEMEHQRMYLNILNLTVEQLLAVLIDLFVAGTETTGNLLGFSLVYMIHHPDVQARVQREIDDILLGQPPSLSDIGR